MSREPRTDRQRCVPCGASLTVFVTAALALLALFVGGASAAEVHGPAGLIGEPGSGNGQLALTSKSGVAVNTSTGNIYVSDTKNHRIEEFEPDGSFVRTFAPAGDPGFYPTTIGIDNSDGDIYVADSRFIKEGQEEKPTTSYVYKFEANGAQVTEWVPQNGGGFAGKLTFGELVAIAVGPSGQLYVDSETSTSLPKRSVYGRYGPSGALTQACTGRGSALTGFSVGIEANLFVGTEPSSTLVIGPNCETLGERSTDTQVNAIDPSNGDLFLAFANSHGEGQIRSFAADCGEICRQPEALEEFARGELSDPEGMGVGPGHLLYVAEAGISKISVFALEIVEPPTVGCEPPSAITQTSVQLSCHINPNAPAGNPPAYKVEWEFTCAELESEAPTGVVVGGPSGELPADAVEHTVAGAVTGLAAGTEYACRITARNAANKEVQHVEMFTTAPAAPTAGLTFSTEVTTSEATLRAKELNPHGAETTYYFEYVARSVFEEEEFDGSGSPAEMLPVGNRGVDISARISGLSAGTTYAYHLVAKNSVGTLEGPVGFFSTQLVPPLEGGCLNEAFRTGAGAALPDCRAYEQVSPINKGGLELEGFPDLLRAAVDGIGEEPAVTFYSQAASGFPAGDGGHQEFVALLSSRAGEAWSTQRLLPPEEDGEKAVFLGASSNLRFALVAAGTENKSGLYLIDTATESVTQVARAIDEPISSYDFADDAIANDGSWVYFESRGALEGVSGVGPREKWDNVYRWDRASASISVVGLRPTAETGRAPTYGSLAGPYAWQSREPLPYIPHINIHEEKEPPIEEEAVNGGAMADLYVEATHAVSADGDRVYFTGVAPGSGQHAEQLFGQLYLREGLNGTEPTTIRVSPKALDGNEASAAFQEATPDGSSVFFLSAAKLTSDATDGTAEGDLNLYRWSAVSKQLTDIAPASEPAGTGGPEVQGLLGVASDGSIGYFVARADLATGATGGQENLYRFKEEGGDVHLSFVTALDDSLSDQANWSSTSWSARQIGNYGGKSARVTPDGEELVFSSTRSITGYDNDGCEGNETEPCAEIYMYSGGSQKVLCISCNPTGARAVGNAELTATHLNGHLGPAVMPSPIITRNLSTDGARVFFESPDSLVSGDTNGPPSCKFLERASGTSVFRGVPTCMDVYEWEAPNAPGGSCRQVEVNGGCLYLLSTGTSEASSYFVDASADGRDVFIATASPLVPVDRDDLYDVYDVREGGGLASQQSLPEAPCESDEACRGSAGGESAAPYGAIGSSSFKGPGNPRVEKSRRCRKGFARKHGKCVKKPKSKKTTHRKHRRTHSSKGDRK
jgi:hypothetical protein